VLVPLLNWLHVDCADRGATSPAQTRDQRPANETACAGYDNSAIRKELRRFMLGI